MIGNLAFTNGKFTLGPTYDPDAQAFLTATGITDLTISDAINDLVLGLKQDNLWNKFFAIYPFVGGTATTNKYNLKNPLDTNAAYRLTFYGSFTYDANGVLGTTTSQNRADTNLIWSDIPSYTQYPFATIYMNGGTFSTGYDFGSLNTSISPEPDFDGIISYGNNTAYVRTQGTQGYLTYNHGGMQGLYCWGQNATNGRFININGDNKSTGGLGTFTAPDLSMMLWNVRNNNSYPEPAPRRYAFAGFGEDFNATDMTNLYVTVQAFQTALGRQV